MSIDKQIKSFFILGLPRSGTTLLEQMLDQHSDIKVCPEITSGQIIWRLNAAKKIKDRAIHLLLLNYISDRASFFNTYMNDCLAVHALREFSFPICTVNWFKPLIMDFVSAKKAHLFGEKAPENIVHIKELQSAFPGSKFIIMVRHPLDVIYSIYENASHINGLKYSPGDILKFVKPVIKRYLNTIIKYKKEDHPHHLLIKYEELINDPQLILVKICQFLGIEFEPQMLDYQNKKEFSDRGNNMKKIHGLLNMPIDKYRIHRSFQLMEPKEILFANDYFRDELKILGYSTTPITTTIPIHIKLMVTLAKLKYYLKLDLLDGFLRKLRFQVHYLCLKYITYAPIQNRLKRRFAFK